MVYLLLPNGTGVLRRESITVESSLVTVRFADAPSSCYAIIRTPNAMFKTVLKDNTITIDISRIRGELKFTVVADDGRKWQCDPILIGEGKHGGLFIATKTNLGEKIAKLAEENTRLSRRVTELESKLLKMEQQLEGLADGYNII